MVCNKYALMCVFWFLFVLSCRRACTSACAAGAAQLASSVFSVVWNVGYLAHYCNKHACATPSMDAASVTQQQTYERNVVQHIGNSSVRNEALLLCGVKHWQ
jgi:hypothetical protein